MPNQAGGGATCAPQPAEHTTAVATQAKHAERQSDPAALMIAADDCFYAELAALFEDCRSLILGDSDVTHLSLSISMYKSSPQGVDGNRKAHMSWGYAAEFVVERASSDELDEQDDGLQRFMGNGRYLGHQTLSSAAFFRSLDTAEVASRDDLIHPSIDVVLPWPVAAEYITTILCGIPLPLPLPYRRMTTFSLLILDRRSIHAPLFWLPDERTPEGNAPDELLVGFGLHPYIPASLADDILPRLALASELAFRMGGKRYLIGWLPFEDDHWKRQLGDHEGRFIALKRYYDPKLILNPTVWKVAAG